MKKNISFAVLIAIACFFGGNLHSVSADVVVSGPGCTPDAYYSVTTGKPCRSWLECAPSDLYSSVTGKPCKIIFPPHPIPPVPCEIVILPIWSRGDNVRMVQQKLKDAGFLSGKVDGIYGPVTSAAAARYSKLREPCPVAGSSTVISGVKGPQYLDVNQQGNWTVSAYNTDGGELSYSVVWGDEAYTSPLYPADMMEKEIIHQEATFSHSYSQAGTYNPTFTVTSPNTIRCIQAPCPGNGGSAQTSLSVKVGETVSNY